MRYFLLCFLMVLSHLRSGTIKTLSHSQDHGPAQDTAWAHLSGSLRVNMPRLLPRVIHCEGDVFSATAATDGAPVTHEGKGRGRARECAGPEVDCGTGPSCHEEHEVTRLSAEQAAGEAAASVAAALDRWQAAETSRRRALEASKRSAEAVYTAQRVFDEVLDNVLKSVEGCDK